MGWETLREDLRVLSAARDLLFVWTAREFKARYAGSALGVMWAVVYPLSFLLVLVAVFSWLLDLPTDGIPAPLFIYCGLAPWLFTSGTIQNASFAVVANMELVKNGAFPREVLPLATMFVGCVDFAISAVLLALLLLWFGAPLGPSVALLPMLVAIQALLTLAFCFALAASVVLYRDVRFLVPIGLQFWMYLSPVFYPIELVPAWARAPYMLNPMAALIDAYRDVLLFARWPDWPPLLVAGFVSILGVVVSYAFFKRAEWQFADRS